MVNLARKCGFDAEQVLTGANEKFVGRFVKVEEGLGEKGMTLEEATLDEMEAEWQGAKGG